MIELRLRHLQQVFHAIETATRYQQGNRWMEDHSSLTRHELLSCMEFGKVHTAEDEARRFDIILKKVSVLLPAEEQGQHYQENSNRARARRLHQAQAFQEGL